jgi:hypothetical protein
MSIRKCTRRISPRFTQSPHDLSFVFSKLWTENRRARFPGLLDALCMAADDWGRG